MLRDPAMISDLLYLAVSSPSVILLVLVLLIAPYVINTARQQWIAYRAIRNLPCDPDQHWFFGHAPKVHDNTDDKLIFKSLLQLNNMGTALDWYLEISMKHQCKIVHTKLGPMFATVELTHPDTARVGLGSGVHVSLRCALCMI